REDGEVKRAYLGVTGGEISSEIAEALNLPAERGVLIEQVFEGGPADAAGINGATGQATIGPDAFPVGGDIITEVGGKEVAGMEEVIAAVDRRDPGDELTLTVLSDDDEREVTVKLGERPANVKDASVTPPLP
ncbi:MAG: S1C family serine protease, partial [Solirubrobacterales bacterium]